MSYRIAQMIVTFCLSFLITFALVATIVSLTRCKSVDTRADIEAHGGNHR